MEDQLIDVYLVCNARFHDTNFARLELLKLLGENEDIHTRVADSFADTEGIKNSKLLITYTCDLRPTPEEQVALGEFLSAGGRWFALHATNAILEFVDGGKVDTPDIAPDFMNMLGSRFVAHPANQKISIRVTDVEHPLTTDISDFEVEDEEPYYCEPLGEQQSDAISRRIRVRFERLLHIKSTDRFDKNGRFGRATIEGWRDGIRWWRKWVD